MAVVSDLHIAAWDVEIVPGQPRPPVWVRFAEPPEPDGEPTPIPPLPGAWSLRGGWDGTVEVPITVEDDALVATFTADLTEALGASPLDLRLNGESKARGRWVTARAQAVPGEETATFTVVEGSELLMVTVTGGAQAFAAEAVAAADAAGLSASAAEGSAGAALGSEQAAALSAEGAGEAAGVALGARDEAVEARGDAVGAASAAGAARDEAVEAQGLAEVARDEAEAARDGAVDAAVVSRAASVRSDLPRLLREPHDPSSATGGPLLVVAAGHYEPGQDGDPGRYPNLQDTGAELSALEPETASSRPVRLTHEGQRYVWVPDVPGNGVTSEWGTSVAGDLDVRVDVDMGPSGQNIRAFAGHHQTGGNQRAWRWRTNSAGTMALDVSLDGASSSIATATAATPTGRQVLRVTRSAATGDVAFWAATDGGGWVQVGETVSGPPGALFASSVPLGVGCRTGPTDGLGGRIWSAEVRDDGDVVASWSAADMGQTGGVSGGREWTISRAAGKVAKAVVVDRDIVLFDGTDWLEIPHDPRLDEVRTVLHAYRRWGAAGSTSYLVQRMSGVGNGSDGWNLAHLASGVVRLTSTASGPALMEADGLNVVAGRLGGPMRLTRNGERASPAALPAAAPASTVAPLRIGASIADTLGAAQEWLWTAVWDRVLTDAEIDQLTAEAMGWPEVHAERIDIDPTMGAANSSWSGLVASGDMWGGVVRRCVVDGGWVEWPVDLSVGTWSVQLRYPRYSGSGIVRVDVDGVPVGTVDQYASSTAYNAQATVGFSVAQPGRRVVRLTVDGKNEASSGYAGYVQALALLRTDGT